MASLKKFIMDIDVEFPNLDNEDINKIYFLTKEKHRPGQLKNSKPEIKPESEGGMSYWSMRTHRWVLPKLDKQTKKNSSSKEPCNNIFICYLIFKLALIVKFGRDTGNRTGKP